MTTERSRKSIAIALTGLLLVIPVNLVAAQLAEDDPATTAGQLLEPPREGGIWLLGNSIFKTGVDPELLQAKVTTHPVDFEYHGGHYTSLWYLIARHALPDLDVKPDIVVWGFRPRFALLPAFRQNQVNDTELFLVPDDRDYERLAEGISDPDNILDEFASDLDRWVSGTGLYAGRERAAEEVANVGLDVGLAIADTLDASGADLVRERVVNGDATLLDVLNAVVTGGEVQLAEERVVDGVGDFVEGEPTDFEDGFLPLIAEAISDAGVEQLVIIWPPRVVAEGTPTAADDAFVADALVYFDANDIPVLDLYNEDSNTIDYYASGDHFNPEGRAWATSLLATRLAELGYR